MEKVAINAPAQPFNPVDQCIRSMLSEGLASAELKEVYALKIETDPHFFAELILDFCRDAEETIGNLTQALQHPALDFYDLREIGIKLKGMTTCVGCRSVAIPVIEFVKAVEDHNAERCNSLAEVIRREYHHMHGKLYALVQMEYGMINHGNSGSRQ